MSKKVIHTFYGSLFSRLATLILVSGATLFFVAVPSVFATDTYTGGAGTILSQSGSSLYVDFSGNQTFFPLTIGCDIYGWIIGQCGAGAQFYNGVYPDTSNYAGNSWGLGNWSDLSNWNIYPYDPDSWYGFPDKLHFWVLMKRFDITDLSPLAYSTIEPLIYVQFTKDAGTGLWSITSPQPSSTPADTSTHIISVSPTDGSLLNTWDEPTFGYTGYLDFNDQNNGTSVLFHIENADCAFAGTSCDGDLGLHIGNFSYPNVVYFNYVDDLSDVATHTFAFSTSTGETLPVGKYYMTTTIRKGVLCLPDWLGGFCFNTSENIFATTTSFIVSTTTKTDAMRAQATALQNAIMGISPTSSSTPAYYSFAECGLADFDLGLCAGDIVIGIFEPSPEAWSSFMQQLHDGALSSFPLGYISRFVSILSSTTPENLPALSYKFGSSSPPSLQALTASDPITFNPFASSYYGSSSPLMTITTDDGQNKNVWDTIDPYIQFMTIAGVLFVVLEDLLGLTMPKKKRSGLENYQAGVKQIK